MGPAVALTYRFDEKAPPYAKALQDAGAEPVLFRAGSCAGLLEGCAGLLLSGGTDLNPALYGAARDPMTGDPDDERDRMEMRLIEEALRKDLPVLAICRGMQLFNVFHGGTLRQHVEGHVVRSEDPAEPVHRVRQKEGSRLAEIVGERAEVNSRHHQAVERVGEGLTAVSWAEHDDMVEGLELAGHRFALAVQWHPEDQAMRFPEQMKLFQAFAAALSR